MKNVYLIILILFGTISCQKEDPQDCAENVACTEEFATVSVKIFDLSGDPIIFDHHRTIVKETNEVIFEKELTSVPPYSQKYHTILTDNEMSHLAISGTFLVFEGLINDVVVLSQEYVIGHDCCHIELIEGPKEIIMNPIECPDDLGCTKQLVSIFVTILDENNTPIELDYTKTILVQKNTILTSTENPGFNNGIYELINDGAMPEISRFGSTIRFEAGIQDAMLIDQEFIIGHDCCHILKLHGPDSLYVQ
jgi:hypothetical protein